MNLIIPSKSLERLKGFCARVDRLEADNYSNIRFRTYDIERLKTELGRVVLWASIGIHNKNKERAKQIIGRAGIKLNIARELLYKV